MTTACLTHLVAHGLSLVTHQQGQGRILSGKVTDYVLFFPPVCQMWLLLCGWEQHPMLQACLGWSAHQLQSTVICPPSASASQAPPPASQRLKMSVCTNQVPHMRYKLQCAALITMIASIFYANVIASWGLAYSFLCFIDMQEALTITLIVWIYWIKEPSLTSLLSHASVDCS